MHLIALVFIGYVIYAEWRMLDLRKKLQNCREVTAKIENDKTIWYSGVLPQADELCLFQENDGTYVIAKLSDKRWQKKDGTVDFERIKRWVALRDLDNI